MNADTRAFACASSPAMNTSNGRPSAEPAARTLENRVLNALTTCAPAGAALAISCAPELPSGVTKPLKSGVTGLVMSMMTLPCRASPYSLTTAAALAYGTARMTMSPAGAVPAVPTVAPSSAAANSLALAGSRPMISTALPPASARSARALAMFPRPMMLMLLMTYPVLVDDRKG